MANVAETARASGAENDNVIEVRQLTRRFDELVAVDAVSFEVGRKEIFGFLGPNGAGKTTTISMLCTLLKPTSGHATLNGFDVSSQQDDVRQSIGIVFQDPTLDERLTARENLQFHAMLYNVPPAERSERSRQVLEMVELTSRADDRVETYSGGMRRRLEIARGLMHYPHVLFLDEPTLGLDPQTRSNIWQHVHELREQYDITIFMTTHYMDEAENCDRIAIIDDGRIAALDTPGNLKHEVGGDIITLRVEDAGAVAGELKQRFDLDADLGQVPQSTGGPAGERLRLEVPSGRTFLPRLLKGIEAEILSVTVREPTLDDVFLKLTGRQIRDGNSDGREGVRARVRSRKVMRH